MKTNAVIEAMLQRKSIRGYTKEIPSDEVIESIVRAGQQAPFAAQMYSFLLSKSEEGYTFGAPLLFTICVDSHKLERIMEFRNWTVTTNDLSLLLFGIQDGAYAAQNMVMAAESLGLGSCFLGGAPYRATEIAEEYKLPERVFPLVQLVMGYPDENPPPRPRYPLDYTCFEGEYPRFTEEQVREAARVMDEGYLAQEYYRRANFMVRLEGDREETFTFDDYGWTEHISRKWGQWFPSPEKLLEQFTACGFDVAGVGAKVGEKE